MKMIIFYISGTGNTYYVAKKFKEKYKDVEIKSIKKFDSSQDLKDKKVGIFFPIHMASAPLIVRDLAFKIKDANYIFSVCTYGGFSGIGLRQIESELKKNKLKLNASFKIMMPDSSKDNIKTDHLINLCDKKINKIIDIVKKRRIYSKEKGSKILYFVLNPLFTFFMKKMIHKIGNTIKVSNKCKGCGMCVKICPVDNINVLDGKAVRANRCIMCTACFNWCPYHAIFMDEKKDKYYTNPKVEIKDMFI